MIQISQSFLLLIIGAIIPITPRSSILILLPGSFHETLIIGTELLVLKDCNIGILVDNQFVHVAYLVIDQPIFQKLQQ